jgi:GT2 family glycosyltransferase
MTGVPQVDISIVIPAFFGARTIAACIESVERAAAGRRCEIIVVESSGDATEAIVRQRFPDVAVLRPDTRLSAGAARNHGAAAAVGRLVFFVDQDCVVPADWIERLERHLEDPRVGAAGGSVGINDPSNLSGCGVYFLEFLYHFPRKAPPDRDRNFLVGCNSAYRAEALRSVRFPDRTLAEDVLLSHELRANGFVVVYDPAIEVRHNNRQGWAEFFRYNRKMGHAAAQYHGVLQRSWVKPFLAVPVLAFLAPAVILPAVAMRLARSRWSYFFRFLQLSPMCLAGNLVWAAAFRRQVLKSRAEAGGHRRARG